MSSIQQTGMTEQLWPRVVYKNIQSFSNLIKLKSVVGIFANQKIILKKTGQEEKHLLVARVLDTQHVQLIDLKQRGVELDLSPWNGGTFDSPEQTRVINGEFSTLRNVYMEEPVMAFRTTPVTPDGTSIYLPGGQIGIEEPDTNFVYDDCYNLSEIREYAHSSELVTTELITADSARKLLFFSDRYPECLQVGGTFLYYERQLDNSIENNIIMTVVLMNSSQVTDTYEETINYSGNVITTPTAVPWAQVDRFIKIQGGLNDGLIVKITGVAGVAITVDLPLTSDTALTTLDGTVKVIEVDVTPPTDGPIEATLDSNLGGKLKQTHLSYGDALQIEAMCSEIQEVTEDDLIDC